MKEYKGFKPKCYGNEYEASRCQECPARETCKVKSNLGDITEALAGTYIGFALYGKDTFYVATNHGIISFSVNDDGLNVEELCDDFDWEDDDLYEFLRSKDLDVNRNESRSYFLILLRENGFDPIEVEDYFIGPTPEDEDEDEN